MNRLLLYRNFEHEDLVYQMRTLAKKAQIDALTEDDLECYENCIHQMIEMGSSLWTAGKSVAQRTCMYIGKCRKCVF